MSTDAIKALQHYEQCPVDFCKDVIGVDLDDWQIEAFRNLQEKRYLAIRSGSGVGKTAFLAFALLWFISTKPYCRIPTTAPSKHQLFDLLWAECYRWMNQSKFLSSLLDWKCTRITVKGYDPVWYAVASTAKLTPENMVSEGLSGYHSGDNLLFILDEASGIDDAVIPAVEGALTDEHSYSIVTSNPTRREGYFFDIFHKAATGKRYAKMHVSCLDSKRVSQHYIEFMLERYGKDHPVYRIKVLGEFPEESDEKLIPYAYVDKMQSNLRDTTYSPLLPIELGGDVGRTKAASVCVARQGFNVLEFAEKPRFGKLSDTMEVAQWFAEKIQTYKPSVLRIDSIYDPGVYDMLATMFNCVVPVVGNASALDPDKYINLRGQGYWHLRDGVPKLWCASWPDRVILEMYDIEKKINKFNGKLGVESKDEMRARGMRSPDYLDALMYAYMSGIENIEVSNYALPEAFIEMNKMLTSSSVWNREDSGLRSRWRFN